LTLRHRTPILCGPMKDLPQAVSEVADLVATLPGAVAVVLGGSRESGGADAASDWDLGLYYRKSIDLNALAASGTIHPPGSWGRLMNGGAWLRHNGERVDVILRDLDVVEHWTARAEQGEFEVDALLGYLAGIPTYSLCAERASCRLLRGTLAPVPPFPPKLAAAAPPWWRFRRTFSLDYARMHARRGNVIGATGQAAKAVMEEAHAIVCERSRWICNEKHLLQAAGFDRLQPIFARVPTDPPELARWVDTIATELGVPKDETAPWRA